MAKRLLLLVVALPALAAAASWTLKLPLGYSADRTHVLTSTGKFLPSSVETAVKGLPHCARFGSSGILEAAPNPCNSGAGGPPTVPYLFFPFGHAGLWFGTVMSQSGLLTANTMRCQTVIPIFTLTNATSITFRIATAGVSGCLMGVAIYSADGNTRITMSEAHPCELSNVMRPKVVPAFTLTGGTKYLACYTGNDTTFQINAASAAGGVGLSGALGAGQYGRANNSSAGGVPPTTTGGLVSDTTAYYSPYLLLR